MTNTDSDNSREWAAQAYALLKKQQEEQKQELQKQEEQTQGLINNATKGKIDVPLKIINNLTKIDSDIDQAMDGWRLKRLPRIDRDILRLAYVDINFLNTPVAVACDEAVNLANKYSDFQGRKFINGVLRRLQTI